MSELPWQPYREGETPLDFLSRYLCADHNGSRMGIYPATLKPWPKDVAWMLDLKELRATLPAERTDNRPP
jgi:hypothetical protein